MGCDLESRGGLTQAVPTRVTLREAIWKWEGEERSGNYGRNVENQGNDEGQ